MLNFVWSFILRYRLFVDYSIKKMGLIKFGKRLDGILDNSMMKVKYVLVFLGNSCEDDEC